jgi:hypothetical protein
MDHRFVAPPEGDRAGQAWLPKVWLPKTLFNPSKEKSQLKPTIKRQLWPSLQKLPESPTGAQAFHQLRVERAQTWGQEETHHSLAWAGPGKATGSPASQRVRTVTRLWFQYEICYFQERSGSSCWGNDSHNSLLIPSFPLAFPPPVLQISNKDLPSGFINRYSYTKHQWMKITMLQAKATMSKTQHFRWNKYTFIPWLQGRQSTSILILKTNLWSQTSSLVTQCTQLLHRLKDEKEFH